MVQTNGVSMIVTGAATSALPRELSRSTRNELADILAEGAVEAGFQPVVDLATGAVVGWEALARGPRGSELERPDLLFAAARAAGRHEELDVLCQRNALRAALAAGTITNTEYEAMVYPTWFRSLDELRAPFAPTVAGAGGEHLELVDLEPELLADPFWAQYEADRDAGAYGAAQAGFLQGFLEPSFRNVLHRPVADQDRILTSVFADAARRIAADPQAVSPSYRLVRARVQRVA